MKTKSFKKLEQEIIIAIGRHGYTLYTKIKDLENTDTKIYTKGVVDGCTVSVHRGDISSLTVSFSENYIQMTYSALIALTYDAEGQIQYVMIDHTGNTKYSAIFAEIKKLIERGW